MGRLATVFHLISATEPFETATPVGRVMFQLLGGIAELEKSTIIERTMAGKRRIAREGKWHGGELPYGYGIVEGFLVPREPEASVVRELFRRVASGSSLVAERNRLHAEGIAPKRGGRQWHPARLSRIFANALYCGGRTGIPAIVDLDLWEKARDQIKRNSTHKDTKRFNLLRSRLRCRGCGSTFVVATRRNGPAYYRCASQMSGRSKGCAAVQVRAEPLEAYAWAECLDMLENPEMITQLCLDQYARLTELDAKRLSQVANLQNALADQAAAKQRVIGLVARGKIAEPDADHQLDLINDEEGRIHRQLNDIETNRSLASAYLDRMIQAQATIREVRSRLNLDLPEDRRRAIEALLEVVKVRTIGSGRQKRAELTFCWLGQEPYIPLALKDVGQATTPPGIMNDATVLEDS